MVLIFMGLAPERLKNGFLPPIQMESERDLKNFVHDDDESIYARQLGQGFSNLRFEEPLEREIRQAYTDRNLLFVRWSLGLALLLVAVLSWLDWVLLPPAFYEKSILLRAVVMGPVIFLALWSTFPHRLAKYVQHMLMLAAASVGIAALGVGWVAHSAGLQVPFSGVVTTTFYIYMLLGLRLVPALSVAVPVPRQTSCFVSASTRSTIKVPTGTS